MAELNAAIQLKLMEIAESTTNAVAKGMSFPSQETESDFWIEKFGGTYKRLVQAIAE